ncbi:retroelement polyprotein [Danaus plexippus plexippus]|uniref:RNA-directed DNA polymerase n=1 Tax=Danaus plexippus plexippus TaxID=278856 RepID=A0A212EYM3_DANPL|nr:retroelement polyprotein [Danaus plexippus plexippus]
MISKDMEWLQIEQRRDDLLRPLIDSMSSDHPAANYTLREGVLKKILTDPVLGQREVIVVPKSFQWSLINSFHTALHHPGWEKTLQKIKETYVFDQMSSLIRRFVENCIICRTSKGSSGSIQVRLHPIQKPTAAFQVVHMDITGKLGTRSSEGCEEYVIVIIDSFTKYVLLNYSNNKSPCSSLAAFKRLVHLFGTPVQIMVDGGREFLGEFKVYCDRFGINIHSIAPGISRANGQVERIMSTLKNALTIIKNYTTENWQTALEALQLSFNCTPHRVTGVAPLTLLTRRQHCVPPELLRLIDFENEFIDFDVLEKYVQQKMLASAEYDKQRFEKSKGKLRSFKKGDYVLIKTNPRNQTSLDLKYTEPYEIYKILENDRYMVKRVTGRGRPRKLAHDQLRPAPNPAATGTVSAEIDDSPHRDNPLNGEASEDLEVESNERSINLIKHLLLSNSLCGPRTKVLDHSIDLPQSLREPVDHGVRDRPDHSNIIKSISSVDHGQKSQTTASTYLNPLENLWTTAYETAQTTATS